MSVGSVIGGVVGGVVGFFIGGPTGAIYGASIGFGVGSFLDPITPDAPSVGTPNPEQASMKSTVGDPCPDLCGTAKITGHLLAYGAERTVAIYAESQASGGKGGQPEPEPQVTGYDYYMSWQLGICTGPVDTLYAIYRNGDDLIWSGELDIPASGGKETISIDGFGSIDFYFGSSDQVANTGVGTIIGDSTLNTPLRNFCWAFMNDCKIGNYPRTPTLDFIIKKIPTVPYRTDVSIQTYDCLAFAAIYYILNNLCGLPSNWLDNDDFSSADYTLISEFRGISLLMKDQNSALDYIQGILNHVDGLLNYGIDGAYHPKLIRDDYDTSTIPTIDENVLLDEPTLNRRSWIDTINESKVQYSEIYNVDRPKTYYGTLYWFGLNGNDKNIHDGSTLSKVFTAQKVPDIEDWKVSKVTGGHGGGNFLFRDDGLVYARGGPNSSYGQLGLGSKIAQPSWTQPVTGKDTPGFWKDIKSQAQGFFTIGLTSNNYIYLAGDNGAQWLHTDNTSGSVTTHSREKDHAIWSDYFSAGYGTSNGHRVLLCSSASFLNTLSTPNVTSNLVGGGGATAYELGITCPNILDANLGIYDGNVSGLIGIWCGNQISFFGIGTEDEFYVYSAGLNNKGACGVGNFTTYIQQWTLIIGGPWKCFSSGATHAVAIKTDGTLWACGDNDQGQLGQGDIISLNQMTQIGSASDWVKCVSSLHTTYAINTAGEVWCCGINSSAQCGIAAGGASVRNLTREGSNGIWVDIFQHGTGLFLIK